MNREHLALIAIALAVATASPLASTWVMLQHARAPPVTREGTAAIGGPFELVSTSGDTVTDQSYRGKWLLIFFGYTYCPDACPTALNSISIALEKLGQRASNLQPVFVTVDPRRDTREVMREYLKPFDSRIVGLTGTQDQIDDVLRKYRLYVAQQKSENESNDYLVDHSAYIYLIDPNGKFVDVIHGNETGEAIAAWVHEETSRSGSWWSFR
ncbi:SCO family protein [Bradyrhizobium sp.]|uniref:SCO family protein n=1 Tax=Bradyrhizobium sp. TaxID=376 RepID=UPI0040378149